jgi:hypothetical protein
VEYILEKSKADNAFHESLSMGLRDPQSQVGLVLCERLINMPVPVIPPMYRMLVDEMKDAVEEVRHRLLCSSCINLWLSCSERTLQFHASNFHIPCIQAYCRGGGNGYRSTAVEKTKI